MEEKAIVRQTPGALALPDFVDPKDRRGADNITSDDIRLPRLVLAQGQSPEVTNGDPKRIAGLEKGDIFSNLLQTNYKSGPVEVVIVRRESPRAVEFWRTVRTASDRSHVERAVKLSVEKYCSVAASLRDEVCITHEVEVEAP